MRIVYLIAGTFNSGGMERVLTNKANWLVRNGFEVSIVTTDQRGRKPYFALDERIQTYDLDINYDVTNGHILKKIICYPLKQWLHKRRLAELLDLIKADVVICMFNNDVSFVYKLKDGSHKILEAHFSKHKKLQYGRRGLWTLADRWRTKKEENYVRQYDKFVVLTNEDKQLWGNLSNIVVIPNARTFEPVLRSNEGQKRVLAIGRYDYQKGFDTLLNIWQRLGTGTEGWQLDIVGDGPLRVSLQRMKERMGLGNVNLVPPMENVKSLYQKSSIFVLTSRYEGLPMVLLEAQASGLPIVAFACKCGPRDIVTDGVDGFLVEERNKAVFVERLGRLMADADMRRRMGDAAVANSENYGTDAIMKKWEKLLSSLL